MYADDWSESLSYLYCRTPHYLDVQVDEIVPHQTWDYGDTEGFEWIGDYSSGYEHFEDQVFRVEIIYNKDTREIKGFHVTREFSGESSYSRSLDSERSISSENKSSFYSVFRPLITKNRPQTSIESHSSNTTESIENRIGTTNSQPQTNNVTNVTEEKFLEEISVIKKWCDGGDVYVPDLLMACSHLLKNDRLENAYQISLLSRLIELETDIRTWGLYAFPIVMIFRKLPKTTENITNNLRHILGFAKDILDKGINYWQYQLAYNPAQEIVDMLERILF